MFGGSLRAAVIALSVTEVLAGVKMLGVNIAGFDFGCDVLGSCPHENVTPPMPYRKDRELAQDIQPNNHFQDGPAQMKHFRSLGLNIFRLPVSWQFLVNHRLGGKLEPRNFAFYDELVQACLKTGSHCIVDIHNYARWNRMIIGQGRLLPTEHLANLWGELAKKYAKEGRVIMGLMNEPHDMDMDEWADTLQAVVKAIRQAGATTQTILLPGTDYTHPDKFVKLSAPYLSRVTNPDGSTTNLVYELHQYFDGGDAPGNECRGNQIDAFAPVVEYLRKNKRRAMITEIGGGGPKQVCMPLVRQGLRYLNDNADVFTAIVGWGAGAFSTRYSLSLTPTFKAGTGWVDKPFLTDGLLVEWKRPTRSAARVGTT